MDFLIFNSTSPFKIISKHIELVNTNDICYLEVDNTFENIASIVEWNIALTVENESLKERIKILEDRLKITNLNNQE
ncbi:hypothetical protein [Xanthocytophaga agilis]|uniref:Uncharacterized protein n=1 Tax=Xanthocytophaga agilis TaxID=3048010 RepID=A0AAE3R8B5_9BACT|nr:hypothetical protein [Xanthocytophaga agilis]MDJ1503289.1 hypothetical protein [Xanthocytophaga agilis]